MKKRLQSSSVYLLLLILFLALSACSGGGPSPSATQSTGATPVKAATTNVAEAEVVPIRQVTLSFSIPGTVEEILVPEGQVVKAGQPIARLQGSEKLTAAISGAELELLNAQKALNDLKKNADVGLGKAQLDLANAKKELDDAQKKMVSAKYDRATSENIEAARAQYVLAQKQVDAAQKVYDKLADRAEKDPVRAQATVNLENAKKARDQTRAALDWLLGFPTDLQIEEREAKLAFAEAQVAKAQREYDARKNGPDPDELALAEARVRNAEAQLRSARAAYDDLQLLAPFEGTVINSDIKVGQYVNPGQNTVLLADVSTWQIETTDLIELKVVDIKEGDPASITFDALPDVTLTGKVLRIKPLGVNKQGDITYTVVIALDQQDPRLRWKMTAVVSFK